jgi:hypothetical protein
MRGGCWLLVAGCWLLVAGCRLPVRKEIPNRNFQITNKFQNPVSKIQTVPLSGFEF